MSTVLILVGGKLEQGNSNEQSIKKRCLVRNIGDRNSEFTRRYSLVLRSELCDRALDIGFATTVNLVQDQALQKRKCNGLLPAHDTTELH